MADSSATSSRVSFEFGGLDRKRLPDVEIRRDVPVNHHGVVEDLDPLDPEFATVEVDRPTRRTDRLDKVRRFGESGGSGFSAGSPRYTAEATPGGGGSGRS